MRVLVAPDKFKGSLSAAEVADCLCAGLTRAGAVAVALPLADGGDGSVDAALRAGFRAHTVTVAGATGLPRRTRIAIGADTAMVELARTCGMSTLPGGRLAPLDSSSLGLGQGLRQALRHRPRRVLLPLGGSASTDGGMGLLTALGLRFLDRQGAPLAPSGRALSNIAAVDGSGAIDLGGVDLVAVCDVTNPLLGPEGAAAAYGPQKGASPADITRLEAGLADLVAVLRRDGYPNAPALADFAGAGSAGGVGFATLLLGARPVGGAAYFLGLLDFPRHAAGCDLIVTAEGRLDDQSAHGKLPAAIAARAGRIPVVAVAGRNELSRGQFETMGFAEVHALADRTAADTAADPELTRRLLVEIGESIARSRI